MFFVSNFLVAAATVLSKVLDVYQLVVVVAVLISWVSPDPFNPLVRLLRSATEPVFDLIRRKIPMVMLGVLDLSPLVLFGLIWFAKMFLVTSLYDLARAVR